MNKRYILISSTRGIFLGQKQDGSLAFALENGEGIELAVSFDSKQKAKILADKYITPSMVNSSYEIIEVKEIETAAEVYADIKDIARAGLLEEAGNMLLYSMTENFREI